LISFGHCIVSPSLICTFLITPWVSFGHWIVSPSLICTFLIIPLVSFDHCIASLQWPKDTKGVIVKKPQIKEGLTIQWPKDTKGVIKKSQISGFLTITPLVSFGHCIVSPSLICTFLITSLVSFGHCIVNSSLIYGFWISPWLTIQWPKDTKGVIQKQ
jgi:hypothetical protein